MTLPTAGLPFVKVHGAGNDFVLIPDLQDQVTLDAALTAALCDRRFGLGGDGVIRLGAPREGVDAEVFMDYRNADGSLAEMCGNGVRTVAKYVADRRVHQAQSDRDADRSKGTRTDMVRIDTRAGVKQVECTLGPDGLVHTCRVDMGPPVIEDLRRIITLDTGPVTVTTLSMGNPHAVVVTDDVDDAPVEAVGPGLQAHPAFPEGVNVEFIAPRAGGGICGRIVERGVGETLASGTGASAMGVAAALTGLSDRTVDVHLRGGVLTVEWTAATLYVTGPAVEVGSGTVDGQWLDQVTRGEGGRAGAANHPERASAMSTS
ncbi:diaminopimelate epimerase [Euzebya tangerina]|uniref:diaminopimelate epimerase n=1 Tax=Euzebya tangerina TaxID=591198 RepID=UPI000E30B99B|nr:diaminopimelate epimerase [Euzebya tangerina]